MKQDVLAVVDNEPVTLRDLSYALEIAHRKEDLGGGTAMDIPEYIQKLIDDKLVVQEARRMQMDQNPMIQQKKHAYLMRESVVRLHNEEILQKISVSDDEIVDFYNERYQKFYLFMIEADTEEKINDVMVQLNNGADFQKLSTDYPASSYSKDEEGRVVLQKHSIEARLQETLSGLAPGEYSDVIKNTDKYLIVYLIDRHDPPVEELEKIRGRLKSYLRKQKESERSREYIAELREQADVEIDQDILDAMKQDIEKGEREEWLKDERPLVTVYDSVLTVKQLAEKVTQDFEASKDRIINGWLDLQLVDHAALNRRYYQEADLSEQIERYESQLLKQLFVNKIIIPQIKISRELLRQYYNENIEQYTSPAKFKIQQIVLSTEEEAQETFKRLKEGGDFTWIAQKILDKSSVSREVVSEWFTKGSLDPAVTEIIDTLEPGDISPVIQSGESFKIVRLLDRKEGKAADFDKVENALVKPYIENQREVIYKETVDILRDGADIRINEKTVEEFGKLFQK